MGACQSAAHTIRRSLRLREPQSGDTEPAAAAAKDNRGSFDPSTFDGTYKLLEILGAYPELLVICGLMMVQAPEPLAL